MHANPALYHSCAFSMPERKEISVWFTPVWSPLQPELNVLINHDDDGTF